MSMSINPFPPNIVYYPDPSDKDRNFIICQGKDIIASLEKDSDMVGIKGCVKSNGGPPDGKLGWNDLKAIVDNGKNNGVSDMDLFFAKDLLDNFDGNATSFGKDKYIVA